MTAFNPIEHPGALLNTAPSPDEAGQPIVVATFAERPLDAEPGTTIEVEEFDNSLFRLLENDVVSDGGLAAGTREYIRSPFYNRAVEWHSRLDTAVVPAAPPASPWEISLSGTGTLTSSGGRLIFDCPSNNDFVALIFGDSVSPQPPGFTFPNGNYSHMLQMFVEVTIPDGSFRNLQSIAIATNVAGGGGPDRTYVIGLGQGFLEQIFYTNGNLIGTQATTPDASTSERRLEMANIHPYQGELYPCATYAEPPQPLGTVAVSTMHTGLPGVTDGQILIECFGFPTCQFAIRDLWLAKLNDGGPVR